MLKVLFESFKERLYLPAVAVNITNFPAS